MSDKKIIITGGAGFIGSHLAKYLVDKYKNYAVVVLDALTYAGDTDNLIEVWENKNFDFVQENIVDKPSLQKTIENISPDWVFHLAAESHVDRSIARAQDFVYTNVIGTLNLLEVTKELWSKDQYNNKLFYHISTDEVYGSLELNEETTKFEETTSYNPKSPYAASKASSDHFVRAYSHTYGMPTIISNCSNNYGTHQFPEKLIPVVINKCITQEKIPVYGRGENIRDWIHVTDHVRAIDAIAHMDLYGETFNIGSDCELKNLELVIKICNLYDNLNHQKTKSQKLISFVEDRPGHDLRYAINNEKISKQIGWKPKINFDQGLREVVAWYIQHKDDWVKKRLNRQK